MHRFITRTVLGLASLGLAAPSVMMLEGCSVDPGELLKGGGEEGAAAKTDGAVCGENVELHEMDCFAPAEFE